MPRKASTSASRSVSTPASTEKTQTPATSERARQRDRRFVAELRQEPSPASENMSARCTEYGNTDVFLREQHNVICYCSAYGWLEYQDGAWRKDSQLAIEQRAQASVRNMYREVSALYRKAGLAQEEQARQDYHARAESLARWVKHSHTEHMARSMLALAKPHVAIASSVFDSDPYLFNVANGTLDIRTGTLRPHDARDYLLKQSPIRYEPGATCPQFQAFITQFTQGDSELAGYLQEAFGSGLVGRALTQEWYMLVGSGNNGKSTLVGIIQAVLGDYAVVMSADSITQSTIVKDGASPSPDIARLAGARLAVVSETEQGARIKTALIKEMTGGGSLTARLPYHEPFTFPEQFTFVLDTNHEPKVSDTSDGFWRRVRKVPALYKFPSGTEIKDYVLQAVASEGSGILNWLLEGFQRLYARGWHMPACAAVQTASAGYRESQDAIGLFLSERCIKESSARQPSQALYNAYKDWVEHEMGEHAVSQRTFSQAMTERGYSATRYVAGMFYTGIRLVTLRDTATLSDVAVNGVASGADVSSIDGDYPLSSGVNGATPVRISEAMRLLKGGTPHVND